MMLLLLWYNASLCVTDTDTWSHVMTAYTTLCTHYCRCFIVIPATVTLNVSCVWDLDKMEQRGKRKLRCSTKSSCSPEFPHGWRQSSSRNDSDANSVDLEAGAGGAISPLRCVNNVSSAHWACTFTTEPRRDTVLTEYVLQTQTHTTKISCI